ncbi:GAF domain-containing protein (plasmid) [Deinococcus taeanensis]|uniref:sensor histidine kinase n=1 Tax=Deinococcus taeanensis TaxID=2737050 RepID=UPI001CDBD8D9|nr:ATP-binding protein [Deinococcus taeanensis]UBV44989.1 GAF domain-containing protein [Deinococcus taeanensis]
MMSESSLPPRPWLDLTVSLSRATTRSELNAALTGPAAQALNLRAQLGPPDGPGRPLRVAGQPVATLTTAPDADPQLSEALAALLELNLARQSPPTSWHAGSENALQAFIHMSDHVSTELELDGLLRCADRAFQDLLPGVTVSLLERLEGAWAVRFTSGHIAWEHRTPVPDGLQITAPALAEAERARGPVFIDHWNAEAQGIPQSAAYRAAAFQAFAQPGAGVAMLSVGCTHRSTWTTTERAVFTAAARAFGQALDRVSQAQQLAAERAALNAFVEFKERAMESADITDLAAQAAQVLRATLGAVSVAYLVPHGDLWRATVTAGPLPPRLASALRDGLPLTGDRVGQALREQREVFAPRFTTRVAAQPAVDAFGAVALYPVCEDTRPVGMLAMGTVRAPDWTERERSVFRAVGRSLSQAVDRARKERRLTEQNAQLQAQARSLQAFAQLSADLGAQEDRYALIRRAQEIALSLLPEGFALYYEPEGPLWTLRSQVGSLRNPELQAAVNRGLPYHQTRNLLIPWESGEPHYLDTYPPEMDQLDSTRGVVGATVTVRLTQGGQPTGVFAIGQYHPRRWSPADRALIDGVTSSLTLALDRAASVAELRRTTQDMARSNAALQAANEELEAFAYSVSHDLRAPVRHIAGFTDLLRKSLGEQVEHHPRSGRYLNVIAESAAQMNALIDAMLNLSRVTRQELRLTHVDLNAAVAGVRAELSADLRSRNVTFQVAPLPTVYADAALIRQVLANLLGNAVKYTAGRSHAVIEVWAVTEPQQWTVYVRDNGVGFDPAYAHKLFGVFQRLHRADEFGGTGVGLANVRRILQRHGGNVGAESQPGRGATFRFTLPRPL